MDSRITRRKATQAAEIDTTEIDWEHALFGVDGIERTEVCWGEDHLPWPSSVVRRWNIAAAERYWKEEGSATGAGRFLGTGGAGRALLGEALRDVKDWITGIGSGRSHLPCFRQWSRRCCGTRLLQRLEKEYVICKVVWGSRSCWVTSCFTVGVQELKQECE
jgi:hypothetical protein